MKHKLNDNGLYLLHDMLEQQVTHNISLLEKMPEDNKEELVKLIQQVLYFKMQMKEFEEDVTEKRKQSFQFSVEELYYMYGQFDKFVGIEFHKFSDAAKKYGRNIGGILIYGKKERQNLEMLINSGNCPRSNDFVKVDVSSNYKLTPELVKELFEVGFMSGDIYQLLVSNSPLKNNYIHPGKKEIPNTINIKFDPIGMDPCKLSLYNSNMRLTNGGNLINSEWEEYCGYQLFYSPEIRNEKLLRDRIYQSDGTVRKEVRFYELVAREYNKVMSDSELKEFSALLKERKNQRFEILTDEIRKTGIDSLEKFKAEHPATYKEIYGMALAFNDSALIYSNVSIPVYWDFRSYLHIFLRHCEELQPKGHFSKKTPFAYTQKDIRRILIRAVEQLHDKIQERLLQGLDFRTYGEKALYFNGNYYSLRIENNGRVDSFYPNEFVKE